MRPSEKHIAVFRRPVPFFHAESRRRRIAERHARFFSRRQGVSQSGARVPKTCGTRKVFGRGLPHGARIFRFQTASSCRCTAKTACVAVPHTLRRGGMTGGIRTEGRVRRLIGTPCQLRSGRFLFIRHNRRGRLKTCKTSFQTASLFFRRLMPALAAHSPARHPRRRRRSSFPSAGRGIRGRGGRRG
ncbi:Uncharacterised protein [Kingella potus]|uniref:Uncharacterized protein n=1 Tax=Kingella potus TaxID=265175 RepID=A0A377R026_9NEIS|nr:Uncharacterised protein [Kingella potus]